MRSLTQQRNVLPNRHSNINGSHVLAPLDLETEFGLVSDDICNASLSHDQLFSANWISGNGQYAKEISRLHICRARTHPG